MKMLLAVIMLCLPLSGFSGSHGNFLLNCTSKSLRTHMLLQLNDYDFIDEELYPQKIILSVMGSMSIFDEKQEYGFGFKTLNNKGVVEIYSTDEDKSHVFEIDFRKQSSAQVVIHKAVNPSTGEEFSGIVLACKKYHDV